ncbi:MAG: ribonucleotide-diphosphate reductase subunit alpha, partial [Patescibacteria group bacterium]
DKPIRNSTITTIAPTGTISIIADCSSGIEPVFALAYIHQVKRPGLPTRTLTIVNQTFEAIAKKEGFYSEELAGKIMDRGSVKGFEEVPQIWQRVFVTAPEIDPEIHVKMQAAFQQNTDNCVSKTINLPNSATRDDIAKAYLLAWETGCSGITVYRDGSKHVQVLNISSSLNSGKIEDPEAPVAERPMILRGRTYKVSTPVGEAFITVNRDSEGQPFEVFVTVGRAGMHTMADAEAMGRLVSLSLRLARGAKETDPKKVAGKIVGQLKGIGGASYVGFGKNRVMSLADAIAKVLAEDLAQDQAQGNIETLPLNLTIDNSDPVDPEPNTLAHLQADLCPECGSASFVMEEGCKKCHSCGYSMC